MSLTARILFNPLIVVTKRFRVKRSYKKIHKLALRENTNILTVSNHTKFAINSIFPDILPSKINVFWAPSTSSLDVSVKQVDVLKDVTFWLMIGFGRWEKNNLSILQVLYRHKLFRQTNQTLVLVGDFQGTLAHRLLKHQQWIVFLDYQERDSLEWLYKHADVFLFPSFSEGFGYPPIEAMRFGTQVLASATSAISEVCGQVPLYMCPYNSIEISSRISEFLDKSDRLPTGEIIEHYDLVTRKQNSDLSAMAKMILLKA
jgi:glycosyltransferase involved in cell wall biosynthesis